MSESLKVYELAKEVGIDSISLLDRLKDLGISVKSHMSSLNAEQAEKARSALTTPSSKSKKKTAVKKSPTKTVARKKVVKVKRATAQDPVSKSDTEEGKQAPRKKVAKIRKRTAEGATETVTVEVSKDGSVSPQVEKKIFDPNQNETSSQSDLSTEESQDFASDSTDQEREDLSPIKRPKAPMKSFLKISSASGVAERPRKLNIVKQAEPERARPVQIKRPGDEAQTPSLKTSQSPVRLSKEKLAQMMRDEEAKKKKGSPGIREKVKPEDSKFAEYRKKEVIFLPRKKRAPIGKDLRKTKITVPKAKKRVVDFDQSITVQSLANDLGVKAPELIRKLVSMGSMVKITDALDFDTTQVIAQDYGFEVKNVSFSADGILDYDVVPEDQMTIRPPIVTVMGHVDHGKTSLLDAIRNAHVTKGEAGGITQHIGAYSVDVGDKKVTFIDTPGHEAFSVMRSRGANLTDIVILVVAADDGVMEQTREALSHAKAAGVPIIVAMNKMDKPGANPEKIKQSLAELDLLPEDWGGQTMYIPVSAIAKTGIDQLLESILLQAEILELKASDKGRARGTVLEARLEKGRGNIVSLLVLQGTLQVGDHVVAGKALGRVKALTNHLGKRIKNVGPGFPAEILGFENLPEAGDRFDTAKTEHDAKRIAQFRIDQEKFEAASSDQKINLEDLFAKMNMGQIKELNIILKGDVFGSVEAVKGSLERLDKETEKVNIKVLHVAAGGINESDIHLALASNAIIIGFNVRPETNARRLAEEKGVQIKTYSVIYELIDDVKAAMEGLLDKKAVERFLGRAEVRQTFSVPKIGLIAGTAVIDGKMVRGASVRLLRDSRVIFEGKMSSLKRFKDDAKEVAQGYECGIGLENYNDVKPGDIIEAFDIDLVSQTLS